MYRYSTWNKKHYPLDTPQCSVVDGCWHIEGHEGECEILSRDTWFWSRSNKTCHLPELGKKLYHHETTSWNPDTKEYTRHKIDATQVQSICHFRAFLDLDKRNLVPEIIKKKRNAPREIFECEDCKRKRDG